jgi:hypothetical protein
LAEFTFDLGEKSRELAFGKKDSKVPGLIVVSDSDEDFARVAGPKSLGPG